MDQRLFRLLEVTRDLGRVSYQPGEVTFENQTSSEYEVAEELERLHANEQGIVGYVQAQVFEVGLGLGSARSWERDWNPAEREAGQEVLRRLKRPILVDVCWGLDFCLEVRSDGLGVEFPSVVAFLIRVSGTDAIERENHGMGYHFHYVTTKGSSPGRTNVLLTFDPKEPGTLDTLFWEFHSEGISVSPGSWGHSRKRAVFQSCRPSLSKPGKMNFRPPSRGALALFSELRRSHRLFLGI